MRKTALAVALLGMTGQATAQPADASYPDFARTSIYVPVRDGTRLAVNLYRPANASGPATAKLPVIFAFTPYRARFRDEKGQIVDLALNDRLALRSLIRAGYVVATADIRGKGASFGHRRGFQDRTEARDGYDLVEWLAHQPWSTGKVGMMGCSYLGGTVLQTATTAPPSLKAAFIGASELDKFAFVRNGGIPAQFNTRPDEPPAVDLASIPIDEDFDGALLKAAVAEHAANTPMAPLWYGMPYRDSVSPLTGNAFWEEVAVYKYLPAIRKAAIPMYFWGNWQDEPTAQVLQGAASTGAKFLAGPGSHCVPPPGFDFTGEIRRFFDHALKGIDNGIEREPRATWWLERGDGSGSFQHAAGLPGTTSRRQRWFLGAGKSGTARSVNDGTLATTPGQSGRDRFTVDYKLPPADYFAFWAGPMDDHGLSYTSAPLATAVTLVGFPVARLSVSADKLDADVFVYLDEIHPDGKDEVLSFGRIKLSHRKVSPAPYPMFGVPWHSGRKADVAPLPIGQVASLAIGLTPVSRELPAGARLRVTITGADPRQRNLKDIAQVPPPVLTVTRGAGSAIDLPLLNEPPFSRF
jgi:putative CocE/NonD family hydrolase